MKGFSEEEKHHHPHYNLNNYLSNKFTFDLILRHLINYVFFVQMFNLFCHLFFFLTVSDYYLLILVISLLLWSVAHAEARQVSVTEGEEDHEDDEEAVVVEEDGQEDTRLNVTQHEERNEQQATHDGHRE